VNARSGERLRIVVTGLVGLYPLGGVAWDYLQYVVGLADLGHDVYYHEDTGIWPYNPRGATFSHDGLSSAMFLREFFERYAPELVDSWHYQHIGSIHYGMTEDAFDRVARSADIFLNVSGACQIPAALSPNAVTVFVDTDPGYNQIVYTERFAWSTNVDRWAQLVDSHDVFATYAENIDHDSCSVPRLDRSWVTTRMPVVERLWDVVPPPEGACWTTVMTWNNFRGRVVHRGREYRSKGVEFEKIIDLPWAVDVPLKVAVGGFNAPLHRLRFAGWEVVDAPTSTLTADSYQAFIQESAGEISVAKEIYVALGTGWFSTRSACYLAAGRPVVVQNTSFPDTLPTGDAIFPFTTPKEAAAAIEDITSRDRECCAAARDVATSHFSATGVLGRLIDDIGASHA
jgi:hypothetical protein